MKIFTNKATTSKIIILIIAMILFNVFAPMYHVYADDDEEFGGKLFRPLFKMLAGIGDLVVKGLQKIFLGSDTIKVNSTYSIHYGPAAIFSNIVPGLDANFINPKYTPDNAYLMKINGEIDWIEMSDIDRYLTTRLSNDFREYYGCDTVDGLLLNFRDVMDYDGSPILNDHNEALNNSYYGIYAGKDSYGQKGCKICISYDRYQIELTSDSNSITNKLAKYWPYSYDEDRD